MVFITLFQFLLLYLVTTFDTTAMLSAILDQMPPMMKAFLNDSFFSLLNYDGAAAFGFNHPIVLTLLVLIAINIPVHHISRELEDGTLELLLAHPMKRQTLLYSLWITGALILMLIITVALAGSYVSILLFHQLTELVFIRLMEIAFNLWLLMMLIFTFTLLIAAFGRVGFKAGNLSAAITFFLYLLNFLAEIWEGLSFTRPFNIFSYYEPQKIMMAQANFLPDALVLAILIVIGWLVSLRRFTRRDIP
jgi:ABC-type transport system involved in multi-copper enzyme maturation permease subunit